MDDDFTFPKLPEFDEDVAAKWAELLVYCADDLGAPSFAADLAKYGYSRASMMAARWEDGDFTPRDFADHLRAFEATA